MTKMAPMPISDKKNLKKHEADCLETWNVAFKELVLQSSGKGVGVWRNMIYLVQVTAHIWLKCK